MRGNSFTFDRNDLLEYNLHEISLNRGGSYIKSSEWIKNKGATINPKNKDNEFFKYATLAALHHQEIERNPQRISKLKPVVNRNNLKDIKFPSHSQDWRKFEQNNKSIVLNIHTIQYKTNKTCIRIKIQE